MATNQLSFFATTSDLESLLRTVEADRPLQFVATGLFQSPETTPLQSLRLHARLGIVSVGDLNQAEGYLVTAREQPIVARPVPQRRGDVMYAVDQLSNPATIVFRPGGTYSGTCLIAGQLGTVSDHPLSLALYRTFSSELRRQFERIGSFHVGPDAGRLLDQGWRLTANARSPATYDLSRD